MTMPEPPAAPILGPALTYGPPPPPPPVFAVPGMAGVTITVTPLVGLTDAPLPPPPAPPKAKPTTGSPELPVPTPVPPPPPPA